jgi:hypothetical protein
MSLSYSGTQFPLLSLQEDTEHRACRVEVTTQAGDSDMNAHARGEFVLPVVLDRCWREPLLLRNPLGHKDSAPTPGDWAIN